MNRIVLLGFLVSLLSSCAATSVVHTRVIPGNVEPCGVAALLERGYEPSADSFQAGSALMVRSLEVGLALVWVYRVGPYTSVSGWVSEAQVGVDTGVFEDVEAVMQRCNP